MSIDTKVRLAILAVSVAVSVTATILAAHGIISPLDDPIGIGPH